jgi:Asp-tRNA(Asn)/Glu-tRNA(Gln) amidotransferase B subunit
MDGNIRKEITPGDHNLEKTYFYPKLDKYYQMSQPRMGV